MRIDESLLKDQDRGGLAHPAPLDETGTCAPVEAIDARCHGRGYLEKTVYIKSIVIRLIHLILTQV